ncbi:MAG: hypothetical protein M1814_000581 [Vezdaea aestivalis]|nr:MAG: hypothetical protein M1814_000581 [Vezdaea aestivalis]
MEIIQIALDEQLDINAKDGVGSTPLHLAARANNIEAAQLLVGKGASTLLKNMSGQSALNEALLINSVGLASYLLQKKVESTFDSFLNSSLLSAAGSGSPAPLELVLKETKTDLKYRNIRGASALHMALKMSSQPQHHIKLLCERQCDVNESDITGSSPLIYAAEKGRETAVWLLVQNSCDSSAKSPKGETAAEIIRNPKDRSTLLDSSEVEESIEDKMPKAQAPKRPIEKLKRVARDLQSRRTGFALLSATRQKFPEDPMERLRYAIQRMQPVKYESTEIMSFEKAQDPSARPRNSSEHLARKLRRIERILSKAGQKDNAIQPRLDGPTLVANIEENRHVNLKVFLNVGVDINFQDTDGRTAIYAAACAGRHGLVEQCLRLKADPNLANYKGDTPLHVATREGGLQVVRELLRSSRLAFDSVNKRDNTPLHIAAYAQNNVDEIIRDLLATKIDENHQNSDGDTLLMIAASKGLLKVVDQLLKKKVNINLQNGKGLTALQLAIFAEQDTITRRLLSQPPLDMDLKDKTGNSALHTTCRSGSMHIAEDVVAKGGDFAIRNNDGHNCLELAAHNSLQIVEHIDEKSDIALDSLNPQSGMSLLHMACLAGVYKIVKGLSANVKIEPHPDLSAAIFSDCYFSYAVGSTPLMAAACAKDDQQGTAIMILLLRNGADINARDCNGLTALMYAAKSSDPVRRLSYLLKQGADLTAQIHSTGETALHTAVRESKYNPIRILLSHGADVDARNANGKRPVDIAQDFVGLFEKQYRQSGHMGEVADMIRWLDAAQILKLLEVGEKEFLKTWALSKRTYPSHDTLVLAELTEDTKGPSNLDLVEALNDPTKKIMAAYHPNYTHAKQL